MKRLNELTRVEYETLISAGMMWKIYPEASGRFEDDCQKSEDNQIGKEFKNEIEK